MIFVRLRSLGDTVLMTPGIEVAARAGYEVAVAVEKPFDRVLEGNPNLSEVITPGAGPLWMGRVTMARRIRRFRPDVAVDLHGGSTAAWLTRLSGARVRVGYGSGRNRFLYNHQVADSAELWQVPRPHTVQHQLSPLKSLGLETDPVPGLHVPLRSEAVEWARRWRSGLAAGGPLVLIHPAAAFDTKQWAVENFVELAAALVGEGCRIAVTAGPGQEKLLVEFGGGAGSAITIVDPQPLDRFAALAAQCDLYVGNDTGPTHIAAALGRPVVVIFGSSDAGVWHPWGTPYRLLQADLACIPCPGYYCGEYDEPRCILSIEVAPVVEAARQLLR